MHEAALAAEKNPAGHFVQAEESSENVPVWQSTQRRPALEGAEPAEQTILVQEAAFATEVDPAAHFAQ